MELEEAVESVEAVELEEAEAAEAGLMEELLRGEELWLRSLRNPPGKYSLPTRKTEKPATSISPAPNSPLLNEKLAFTRNTTSAGHHTLLQT